ncbi:hypothetical protein FA95DRAFT_1610882 [Auriscalpium vulgare]|uniref:Uncharacterized protein n=1 Tax=Auriscalpium vulgare TaxID=40419 RepID=A0ACB8RCA4_9AGAM|nr:hypothetical protein FA95DRAFT_1610882 [Auriscalpium vulgare]
MLPSDGVVKMELTESIAGSVTIGLTVTRLWIRRDRYWWDDAWACFSMISLIIQVVATFIYAQRLGHMLESSMYYLMVSAFYSVNWSARISILLSIIRIDPDPDARRKLMWLVGVFVGALVFFVAQLLWVCEPQPGWKSQLPPRCRLTKQVAICLLVSDVIADFLLITLPLRLIQGVKDRQLRHRVMFIFSTSIATTVASLIHVAFILTSGGTNEAIAGIAETCVSLTVANVPVIGTALTRFASRHIAPVPVPETDDDMPDISAVSWSMLWRFTGHRTPFELTVRSGTAELGHNRGTYASTVIVAATAL